MSDNQDENKLDDEYDSSNSETYGSDSLDESSHDESSSANPQATENPFGGFSELLNSDMFKKIQGIATKMAEGDGLSKLTSMTDKLTKPHITKEELFNMIMNTNNEHKITDQLIGCMNQEPLTINETDIEFLSNKTAINLLQLAYELPPEHHELKVKLITPYALLIHTTKLATKAMNSANVTLTEDEKKILTDHGQSQKDAVKQLRNEMFGDVLQNFTSNTTE